MITQYQRFQVHMNDFVIRVYFILIQISDINIIDM
jgi:hypothetical protein